MIYVRFERSIDKLSSFDAIVLTRHLIIPAYFPFNRYLISSIFFLNTRHRSEVIKFEEKFIQGLPHFLNAAGLMYSVLLMIHFPSYSEKMENTLNRFEIHQRLLP